MIADLALEENVVMTFTQRARDERSRLVYNTMRGSNEPTLCDTTSKWCRPAPAKGYMTMLLYKEKKNMRPETPG